MSRYVGGDSRMGEWPSADRDRVILASTVDPVKRTPISREQTVGSANVIDTFFDWFIYAMAQRRSYLQ
jgi:hypothetical protein